MFPPTSDILSNLNAPALDESSPFIKNTLPLST